MIASGCKNLQDEIVKMRRDLHQIPEVGQIIPQTAAYVISKLEEYGVEYTLNKEGDSGLVAYVNRGKGKCIALRADMDGLPIVEETGLPYASTNGCMHACGHDVHTATLLATAKILNENKDQLNGEVRFLFQTAEEICRGAQALIENNCLDGVDAVFGTHVGSIISKEIPAGTFIITPGPIMASFDRFIINVKGNGCHGSTPEKGIDPINIAAHIVLAIQEINAREFNGAEPIVITIGKIAGGAQYNIIPTDVVIEGTTRAFSEEVRRKIAKRIGEIAEYTAKAFGGEAELVMDWGAPSVVNNNEMAAFAADCAKEVLGDDMVITHVDRPNMGGEDFAFYLQEKPGAFMFLSTANKEKGSDVAHHNSMFKVDEDVMWAGAAVFANIAEKFLNN